MILFSPLLSLFVLEIAVKWILVVKTLSLSPGEKDKGKSVI